MLVSVYDNNSALPGDNVLGNKSLETVCVSLFLQASSEVSICTVYYLVNFHRGRLGNLNEVIFLDKIEEFRRPARSHALGSAEGQNLIVEGKVSMKATRSCMN